VDLGAEAAERVALLPLLRQPPSMRPDRGAIEHLDDARGPAATRKYSKESLEGPVLRQSPDPPPDRAQRQKLGGERAK